MRRCEVNAWTMPAPNTPGHDALTATLIGANPPRVVNFNVRVRYAVRKLNEASGRRNTTNGGTQ